jgi:hypothetical protein
MAKKQTAPEVAALKKACDGVLWPSETDAEVTPFLSKVTGDMDADKALRLSDYEYEGEVAVEETTLPRLLRSVPRGSKAEIDGLIAELNKHFTDVRAYKVGDEAEKELIITGRNKDGRWGGLKTTVVET